MKSMILTLLLSANTVFAAQFYEINLDWSAEGLPKTHAQIITKNGEVATVKRKINNEEFLLEVTPKPADKNGILMEFTISKTNNKGEKTILSTPRISALANEPASITLHNEQKAEILSISATAKPSNGKPEYFKR